MSEDKKHLSGRQTRRQFMATTTALAGAAAFGLNPFEATAAKRHPKRGGTLRFATRSDSTGLDPHRNIVYWTSHPLAGTSNSLLDVDAGMNIRPGLAEKWDVSKDLKTWTFQLRKGAEYHNGETVDAQSIKWNIERILDPKIGHSFPRSALGDVERVTVDDKYTVQVHLKNPSAVFDSNVVFFPVIMIAPGAVDTVDTNPQGSGPFKFKSWKRYGTTELVRFENYWQTDEQGNALPYLDGVIGKPKKEDAVRLTALRTGEVDLIDNMAYADAATFKKDYADKYDTWEIPQNGTSFLSFNMKNGPFSPKDNPDAHLLRRAAAHAIDHEGIHQAIFNGQGEIAKGFYSRHSPWYLPESEPWPEFDPDKAKALLKKANMADAKIEILSKSAYAYMRQTGEIVQSMLKEAGFNATFEVVRRPVLRDRQRKGDFNMDATSNSYRIDPDAWFGRSFLSTAPANKHNFGYNNPKVDQMILAAKIEIDRKKRLQIYSDIESVINTDLPLLYSHHVPQLQAGLKSLKGYKPAFAGPFQYHNGGLRTAWLES